MIFPKTDGRPVHILLVEDNEGDVRLTREALREAKVRNELHVVNDGVEAIEYLATATRLPDLILLDLNLPRKDGREVLAEIRADERVSHIPVVVLTTSSAEEDVLRSYKLRANCYITKPVDLTEFMKVIHTIDDFWLQIVQLPSSQETVQ